MIPQTKDVFARFARAMRNDPELVSWWGASLSSELLALAYCKDEFEERRGRVRIMKEVYDLMVATTKEKK